MRASSPLATSRRVSVVATSARLLAIVFLVAAWSAPAGQDAPPPEASGVLAPSDTLVQHIRHTSARVVNGRRVYRLTLKPGTSRATATLLADYVARDGDPGSLTVIGDGFTVERSAVRLGSVPLPPPPPPARRGGTDSPSH